MTGDWIRDDDTLFAALEKALAGARSVPPEFVATGRACFAWRRVDVELAQLMHDSLVDGDQLATTRAEPAVVRALTFVARNLTIEVEISEDVVRGQIIPHQAGEVELEVPGHGNVITTADDLGYFVIAQVSTTSFRLHCRTMSGATVSTSWVRCN